MDTKNKLKLIRKEMKDSKIDVYIIPTNDPHGSEYLPEYYKTRQWVSGFTGSAGTLVITDKKCGLWTDGRYFLQAEEELKGTEIELFKTRVPNSISIPDWLAQNIKKEATIGFNGFQFTADEAESIKETLFDKKIKFDFTANIVDKIWLDRPYLPSDRIFIHGSQYAGETTIQKLDRIRKSMEDDGADYHYINKLDDIAWILNLRGNDIKNNPYFLSHLIIDKECSYLYVDILKLNNRIINYLHECNVKVKLYDDLLEDLSLLKKGSKIVLDKKSIPYHLYYEIYNRCSIINKQNYATAFKAIKNEMQCNHLRNCNIKDGVAMLRFMKWLDESVCTSNITEIIASEMLNQYRSDISTYISTSFDTIAAYKEHAAIMHYRATSKTDRILEPHGLFLVDSGGQYLNGTTDITRTYALGELSDEEKIDYTLVLKGMIQLSMAVFIEGTTGTSLDLLARKPMWDYGIDYKCGSGHGIGFFSGVHEGPHGFSLIPNSTPLKPGMVITNEPGIYKEGRHGIRIENTLLVSNHKDTEFGSFYSFETLTLAPIDTRPILLDLLNSDELKWLNDYHQIVYSTLKPHVLKEDLEYLELVTKSL